MIDSPDVKQHIKRENLYNVESAINDIGLQQECGVESDKHLKMIAFRFDHYQIRPQFYNH